MQTYTGSYYSAQTGSSVEAEIVLTAQYIRIFIKDEYGAQRHIDWYWPKVQPGREAGAYRLGYSGYPVQHITARDAGFKAAVENFLARPRTRPWLAGPLGIVMAIGGGLVIVLAMVYCWLIPFLANRLAAVVPPSYEIKLGQQSYEALIGNYTIDSAATRQLNRFFAQMKVQTPYPVQVTVVEDRQVNAFALPGGHIVVYSRLLQGMQHYEELAALLAHEYAHITLKHTTATIFRSVGTYAFVSLLFGDISGLGAVVVENANSLRGLQYSRRLEKEADLYGMRLLEQRRINPEGYVWLFTTFRRQGGEQPAEWLSSHPNLQTRIKYIQKQLQPGKAVTDTALMRTWEEIKERTGPAGGPHQKKQ